ncbi:MAG: class I SAM-dependent methyltransferase [Solirubrobacterales bacterium]|nr:class I SAM-dependent methyltransferase [Solirubrobacterales bacterium]
MPPRQLRARAGVPAVRDYVEGAGRAAAELLDTLAAAGRGPEQLHRVLDFGAGAGRVLPHLAALIPHANCTGCDVDARAIAWASRHHPTQRWERSAFLPPLPFEPESFDLVYSISVFSHLDEWLQDRWLAELRRILSPAGVALLSVHGPSAFEQFRQGAARTAWCKRSAFARGPLGPGEFEFVPYRRSVWNAATLPGIGEGYGLSFHGHEYVRAHWSMSLAVLELRERAITGWQDIVICRP